MKTSSLLLFLFGIKMFSFLAILFTALYVPSFFNHANYLAHFIANPNESFGLNTYFSAWDTQHYIFLAKHGYQPMHMSSNFFPLWPFILHIGSFFLMGHTFLAGFLLSNLFSLTAFYFLHNWLKQKSPEIADLTILFISFFPGSIFYFFPYSESIFLLFSVVFFINLEKGRYARAALAAFCLVWIKSVGVFIFLPILYQGILILKNNKKIKFSYYFLFCSVPLAVILYLGFMWLRTGNAFEFFSVQKLYPANHSFLKILDLFAFFKDYTAIKAFHGDLHSFLDRFFFTLFILSLPLVWRIDKTFFWFTLPLGLFPPLTGTFMSYTRYLAVIFPIFMAWSKFFRSTRFFFFEKTALAALAGLYLNFLINHSNAYWAG